MFSLENLFVTATNNNNSKLNTKSINGNIPTKGGEKMLKARLKRLGVTQASMIPKLRERGINTNPSELSVAVNEVADRPKFRRMIYEINNILDEMEHTHCQTNS